MKTLPTIARARSLPDLDESLLTHCEVLATISSFISQKERFESDKAQIVRELTAQQKSMETEMPTLKRLLNLGKFSIPNTT